jgi:hypothetical protein
MTNNTTNASKLIDLRIRELDDWRGKTLSKIWRSMAVVMCAAPQPLR